MSRLPGCANGLKSDHRRYQPHKFGRINDCPPYGVYDNGTRSMLSTIQNSDGTDDPIQTGAGRI